MLNDLWVLVSAILVLIGLVASEGLLLIVGSLVIIVWLATKLWDRFAFKNVSHSRSLNRRRAFIGDNLAYSVTLRNDKILPLIWVDIHDNFPEGLELTGANLKSSSMDGMRQHTITTSLLPFQQVTWRYTLKCSTRGYHRIGPVSIRSGDIFGFSAGEVKFEEMEHVLVYPRIVDLGPLSIPSEHPLGDGRGLKPLFADPNRIAGQRDYLPFDPMKHIDWKATARVSRLQTKVFEPVVALNLLIALNANTSDQPWETTNRRLFERVVTIAASVASLASQRGYSFGVISNAVATYSAKYISVPLSASASQLDIVLEALARAGPFAVTKLPEVLQAERDALPSGATVVLVSAVVTPSLIQEVEEMKLRGYHIMLLYSGDGKPAINLPGVEVLYIGALADYSTDYSRPDSSESDLDLETIATQADDQRVGEP